MVYRTHSFTHHRWSFNAEAEGWPAEEPADAAIIDIQSWTMQLDEAGTAALHRALSEEREALVYGHGYDRNREPLPAVREAQRRAVQSGLAGKPQSGQTPTVTLEAHQITQT